MKQRTITVSTLETVTDEQFEDILCIFHIVEGVCGAEQVREFPPTPKRQPKTGYQPTHSNLDKSNPPQNSSSVPNLKAVTCPVCYGTGYVDAGFYMRTGPPQWTSAGGTGPCRSCVGKGYVIV